MPAPFAQASRDIIRDTQITSRAFRLFCILEDVAGDSHVTWLKWATMAEYHPESDYTPKMARTDYRNLITAGWIEKREWQINGEQTSNMTIVYPAALENFTDDELRTIRNGLGGPLPTAAEKAAKELAAVPVVEPEPEPAPVELTVVRNPRALNRKERLKSLGSNQSRIRGDMVMAGSALRNADLGDRERQIHQEVYDYNRETLLAIDPALVDEALQMIDEWSA